MEKDLFPSRAPDLPLADRMPRMERPNGQDAPGGGCGCGNSNGGCGNSNGGCGCGNHHSGSDSCGACVGFEGCGENSWGLPEHPLAMVYAPCQMFRALYDPATALNRGTLFTELDLPLGGESGFTAEGCACRMERRRV